MNTDQFTTLLIKSRLISQDDVNELAAAFNEACHKWNAPNTVERFCDLLIATNRLTEWQCNKLKMGKWKGFNLDNYLMLEHIAKDEEYAYYKARDARDGKLVRLSAKPSRQAKNGIEYRVEPYSE